MKIIFSLICIYVGPPLEPFHADHLINCPKLITQDRTSRGLASRETEASAWLLIRAPGEATESETGLTGMVS